MKVLPPVESEKVKLTNPNISEVGVPASLPTTLNFDTNDAGLGDLEVRIVVSYYRFF